MYSVAAQLSAECAICGHEKQVAQLEQVYALVNELKAVDTSLPLLNPDTDPILLKELNEFLDKLVIEERYVDLFGKGKTMRELLEGKTQRLFAKSERDQYGFSQYNLHVTETEKILVTYELYTALNLPQLKQYRGNWQPDEVVKYNPIMEKQARLLDYLITVELLRKAKHVNAKNLVQSLFKNA